MAPGGGGIMPGGGIIPVESHSAHNATVLVEWSDQVEEGASPWVPCQGAACLAWAEQTQAAEGNHLQGGKVIVHYDQPLSDYLTWVCHHVLCFLFQPVHVVEFDSLLVLATSVVCLTH